MKAVEGGVAKTNDVAPLEGGWSSGSERPRRPRLDERPPRPRAVRFAAARSGDAAERWKAVEALEESEGAMVNVVVIDEGRRCPVV